MNRHTESSADENHVMSKITEKDKKCAATKKFEFGSCISLDLLINMAKAYNKISKSKIELNKSMDALNPKKYKLHLLRQFYDKLKCSDQECWMKQEFIKLLSSDDRDELMRNTLRPRGPQGKFEWLSTSHIDNVIYQYEKKYKSFKFIGALPINFYTMPPIVPNMDDIYAIRDSDFKKFINEKKTKLGMICNLDEHWQPGSHWVAVYCDLQSGEIYFFDSYGTRPDEEIKIFMRDVADFIENELGKKTIVRHNNIRHQFKNSECGVYSINFILRLLDGDSFGKIIKDKTPDDVINRYRDIYFI